MILHLGVNSTTYILAKESHDCGTDTEKKDDKKFQKRARRTKQKCSLDLQNPCAFPFNQPPMFPGTKCFTGNGELAVVVVFVGPLASSSSLAHIKFYQ